MYRLRVIQACTDAPAQDISSNKSQKQKKYSCWGFYYANASNSLQGSSVQVNLGLLQCQDVKVELTDFGR